MDVVVVQEVAEAIWPLVAAGAAGRFGGAGTEQALQGAKALLNRVRVERRKRGVAEDPPSLEDLVKELMRLQAHDPSVTGSIQTIHNHVGHITGDFVNLGFTQEPKHGGF